MNNLINRKHRILITDDTESIQNLMRLLLEKNGFEVDTAEDGEMCLQKIKTYRPDLILLDYYFLTGTETEFIAPSL